MSDPCKYCGFREHHPGDKLGDSIPGRTGLLGEHGEGYGGWWGQGKEGGLEGRRDRKGEDPAALREPALGREASEPRTGPAAGGWGPGASKQGRAVARLTQVTRGWSPSLPMTGILPLQGPVGGEGWEPQSRRPGDTGTKARNVSKAPSEPSLSGAPRPTICLPPCSLAPRLPGAGGTERSNDRRRPWPGTCLPTAPLRWGL